ncbi:hypothetical protein SNE40_005204 [Patella caerulea]|uniref:Integrase catalytic domain-containing protein n=1 Tax=Patella caerulea TaxID=87958 RepID=A0AAN8K082_PATCE
MAAHGNSTASYKVPPVLNPTIGYESWKTEIEMWKLVTDLDPKKQALAVSLTLQGQAREKARTINVDRLNTNDGMNILITELDSLFLTDKVDLAYEAYSNFDSYRKPINISMSEFIVEFEQRYSKCVKYQMELPNPVLSFKLLDCSNLGQKERQLALTAANDLKFSTMKSALKRIFSQTNKTDSPEASINLEDDSALYTRFNRNRQYPYKAADTPKGSNPLDRFGRRTKCSICQSIFHWAKDCPDKLNTVKYTEEEFNLDEEQCNITLFVKNPSINEILMTECLGCAVLDTACTRTVCGSKWLDKYINSLPTYLMKKVKTIDSVKLFKFGDGSQLKSLKNVTIPASIVGVNCDITTEVVDADIPLLLSKTSLKRAETVLDLNNDRAMMFNREIQLNFTSTGHYCIDITPTENGQNKFHNEILLFEEVQSKEQKMTLLMKLHLQFGHASSERLKKLLKSAGNVDNSIIQLVDEATKDCEVCIQYKRPPKKPVVGLPQATEFNELVAVDLHQLENNVWYLHIIDHFTRFSAGAIMRTKQSSMFILHFLTNWISIHGAPSKLLSDNGGEFNSQEVRDFCENFNIEVHTTAAYSPWSNGLLERNNMTLTEILLKVKESQSCDWETALAWSLMAKNSLASTHGYSSYQLVYGKNPTLPSVLIDKLPALEGSTTSQLVSQHINALHAARREFIQAECSDRLRRAIRKQTRPYDKKYYCGDKVYYKRPDSSKWKGPATVIGQDSAVIFIRHGGLVVRAHHSRVSPIESTYSKQETDLSNQEAANTKYETYDEHFDEPLVEQTTNDNSQGIQLPTNNDEREIIPFNDSNIRNNNNQITSTHTASYDSNPRNQDNQITSIPDITSTPDVLKLKPGQNIQFKNTDVGKVTGTIISRAGKTTGKFSKWFNIEYSSPEHLKGEKTAIDLDKVEDLKVNNSENVLVLEDVSFEESKQTELENWKKNSVYKVVKNEGQKYISTRWICTLKSTDKGIVPKSRLVARGFEEFGNFVEKDSPTCGKDSLRLILAILAHNNWEPRSMDIKTAFLQSHTMDRDIFLLPPLEANCVNSLWLLNKCVYGLNDASLSWYKTVKAVMLNLNGKISKVDPAVFYWIRPNGTVMGILACHVDDFVWGGDQMFVKQVIDKIREQFNVGKEEFSAFRFLGIDLTCDDNKIYLNQNNYADSISFINIVKSRLQNKNSDLTESERKILQSKIGQILWIGYQSRPDVIFDASDLASKIKNATINDLITANKVIKRLKSEKLTLKFQPLHTDLSLLVFSDASLGNLSDGGSQGGHLIFLKGGDGVFSPIHWNSKRIRRVVRSTLSCETLALADGIDNAIFISTLFAELTTGDPNPLILPITCITDNKSLCEAVKSNKYVSEKRLRLEITNIKDLLKLGQIKQIVWSDTKRQLANCLTKNGASSVELLNALETGVLSSY